jgi:aspartate aminotransferase-like enzyme
MYDYKLYIPGPIQVNQEVLDVMAEPIMPHHGKEFAELYKKTIALVKEIFQTTQYAYCLPGSGTTACDMGISNILYPDKKTLVLTNGFFGDRLVEIAKVYSTHVDVLDFGFGQPFDYEKIRKQLVSDNYDVLLLAQVETSAGIVNPVKELAMLTKDTDIICMVDGVSSIGVEELKMDDWGVDVAMTGSQKGVGAPPGLALLAFNEKAWQVMKRCTVPSFYLNMRVWRRYEPYWGPMHPQLVTHAVPCVKALTKALEMELTDGYQAHIDYVTRQCDYLREQLVAQGFSLAITQNYSHGFTSVLIPDGKAGQVINFLKEKHHMVIAGGLGSAQGKSIRIGHMGETSSTEAIDAVVAALADAKKEMGF